jgi:hypothetical protein
MKTLQARKDIFRSRIDGRLETLCQVIQEGLEGIILTQLNDWATKYPRHSFSASVGHGRLSFEVSPKVNGCKQLEWVGKNFLIQSEARDLIDYFNTFDKENIGVGQMNWVRGVKRLYG